MFFSREVVSVRSIFPSIIFLAIRSEVTAFTIFCVLSGPSFFLILVRVEASTAYLPCLVASDTSEYDRPQKCM